MSRRSAADMLSLAIRGDLEAIMAEENRIIVRANQSGIFRAGRGLHREMRRQTRRAQLGDGLERAWRFQRYPRRGYAYEPASLVYSKATRIHDAFMADRTVTLASGLYQVIPLEAAIARGWDTDASKGQGGGVARKWANIGAAEAALGRLRMVLVRGGALLVHGPRQRPTAYFLLVRTTRHKKRLDFDKPAAKWAAKVPAYVASAYTRAARKRTLDRKRMQYR